MNFDKVPKPLRPNPGFVLADRRGSKPRLDCFFSDGRVPPEYGEGSAPAGGERRLRRPDHALPDRLSHRSSSRRIMPRPRYSGIRSRGCFLDGPRFWRQQSMGSTTELLDSLRVLARRGYGAESPMERPGPVLAEAIAIGAPGTANKPPDSSRGKTEPPSIHKSHFLPRSLRNLKSRCRRGVEKAPRILICASRMWR